MNDVQTRRNRHFAEFEQTKASDDWITPPRIVRALGHFDLDPCASTRQPFRTARVMLTKRDDGLSKEWKGRVFLNPPYGTQTGRWLDKLAEHGDGIALVFGRYDTKAFKEHVWPKAHSVLLLTERLKFFTPRGKEAEGTAGAPSMLIAYGARNSAAIKRSKIKGKFIRMSQVRENPKSRRPLNLQLADARLLLSTEKQYQRTFNDKDPAKIKRIEAKIRELERRQPKENLFGFGKKRRGKKKGIVSRVKSYVKQRQAEKRADELQRRREVLAARKLELAEAEHRRKEWKKAEAERVEREKKESARAKKIEAREHASEERWIKKQQAKDAKRADASSDEEVLVGGRRFKVSALTPTQRQRFREAGILNPKGKGVAFIEWTPMPKPWVIRLKDGSGLKNKKGHVYYYDDPSMARRAAERHGYSVMNPSRKRNCSASQLRQWGWTDAEITRARNAGQVSKSASRGPRIPPPHENPHTGWLQAAKRSAAAKKAAATRKKKAPVGYRKHEGKPVKFTLARSTDGKKWSSAGTFTAKSLSAAVRQAKAAGPRGRFTYMVKKWSLAGKKQGRHVSPSPHKNPKTVCQHGHLHNSKKLALQCEKYHTGERPSSTRAFAKAYREHYSKKNPVITPSLAKKMLKRSVGNRPVDPKKVAAIASLMKRGIYKTTHPVEFTNGILTDGQHRLLAVVKSGVSLQTSVKKKTLRAPNPPLLSDIIGGLAGGAGYAAASHIVTKKLSERRRTRRGGAIPHHPNPNGGTPASVRKLGKTFRGYENGEASKVHTFPSAPVHVAQLGKLEKIYLADGRVMKFRNGQAFLCGSGGDKVQKLHIALKKPLPMPNGAQKGKTYNFGDVVRFDYEASKPHLYGTKNPLRFYHYAGEDSGKRPQMIFRNGLLALIRQDSAIRREGVVN